MKKILLIGFLFTSLLSRSQAVVITDVVTMADGDTASLMYVVMKPDLSNIAASKIITCNLMFYRNKAAYLAGYDKVRISGLSQISLPFSGSDVIKNSGLTLASDVNLFFYNKLKSELLIQKSLNSIVQ